MNLGTFGEPAPEAEGIEFTYFGHTIRANPTLGELDYVDFMHTAGGMATTDVRAAGMVKDFARMCVHPEDFETFWALARANRQGVDDIFPICQRIVEAVGERPTGRSSDSSAGPSSTQQSSEDVDFSEAMDSYKGRPDLQLAVIRGREARTA